MVEELHSLQTQLGNYQGSLRTLREKKSQYILPSEIPVQLLKDISEIELCLKDTQDRINLLKHSIQTEDDTGKEDNAEVGPVVDYLEDMDISKLWIGDELLDKIPIPIFAVDKQTKRKILNWNKACVEYYRIPETEYNMPQEWHVNDLFEQIRIHSGTGNEGVWKKTKDFYHKEIEGKDELPDNGKHGFTVFLTKSTKVGDVDSFREFNRVTNVFYKTLKDNIFISMILTVPLDNFFEIEKLKKHIEKLES